MLTVEGNTTLLTHHVKLRKAATNFVLLLITLMKIKISQVLLFFSQYYDVREIEELKIHLEKMVMEKTGKRLTFFK